MADQFHLFLATTNDAFSGGHCAKDAEIARILHALAEDIIENGLSAVHRLRDVNGNRVGYATDSPGELAEHL